MADRRNWVIDKHALESCVDAVLTRIDEQGDAAFGRIAAEELIEIISEYVGPSAYDRGLNDAKAAVNSAAVDLEINIDSLRRSPYID